MRAAIYARKSQEQHCSDEAKSVTRQVAGARAFAERNGWTLAEQDIYIDDGVSGAEWVDRALNRLIESAQSGPRPFDVLVTLDIDRVGRDGVRTVPKLNEVYETGCKIFFYQTGQEVHLRTPIEVFMLQAQAFGAADYRDKVRAKTRDALRAKAQQGYVAGGLCYGYRNVRAANNGHVLREIHEPEAQIIRRLFELAASGLGLRRLAKRLNADGVPAPGAHGWAGSAIREMLSRELYRGKIVYGKKRWTDKGGTSVRVLTPKSEWITTDAPHLRIVSEDLWEAAHARIAQTKSAYLVRPSGQLWGRPETGLASRYLLTGLSACGVCGSSLFVRKPPSRALALTYGCTYHHLRGDRVCTNALHMPLADADGAVLAVLKHDILNPEALALAIELTIEQYTASPGDQAAQRAAHESDLTREETAVANLVTAIKRGQAPEAVLSAITASEQRCDALKASLAHLDAVASLPTRSPSTLASELRSRLTDWRGLLDAEPVKARQIIRKLVTGRLVFTPDPAQRVYTFTGTASYGRVLAGTVLHSAPRLVLQPGQEQQEQIGVVSRPGPATRSEPR